MSARRWLVAVIGTAFLVFVLPYIGETTFQDIKTPVQTPLRLGYLERRQWLE